MVGSLYVVPSLIGKRIEDSGYKVKFIASSLGLTYEGLRRKCNGERAFTKLEIDALSNLLGITDEEKSEFFSPEKSTNC